VEAVGGEGIVHFGGDAIEAGENPAVFERGAIEAADSCYVARAGDFVPA